MDGSTWAAGKSCGCPYYDLEGRPPRSLTPPVLETKLSPPVRPFLAPTLEFIFGRAAMAMTMTIERVMAFMGLDVLVAKDEGLFAAEGLDLRIAALPPDEMRSAAEGSPTKPTTNQGKLQARGEAQMFQA